MIFFVALLSLLGSVSFASTGGPSIDAPSQSRAHDQRFEDARRDYLADLERRGIKIAAGISALDSAVPFSQFNPETDAVTVPAADTEELIARFERVRDTRFLTLPETPEFRRRSSWLYPDDGCFARAALAGKNLEEWGLERPAKLFIFGNLSVQTPNSPSGRVTWWYHVVPVMMGPNGLEVFDPAIDPAAPLPWQDWVETMTRDSKSVRLALCNGFSYEPASPCLGATASSERYAREQQNTYLRLEWSRLQNLGRIPSRELGDSPPWNS